MNQQQDPNWLVEWLPWVVPLITAGGMIWAALRRFFSNEAQHKENKADIADIKQTLVTASEERAEMRADISRIAEDVAYLRGRIR